MFLCPVCKKKNDSMLCKCGFDGSRDYLRFPTFARIDTGAAPLRSPQIAAAKTEEADILLKCPNCAGTGFVYNLEKQCYSCMTCGTYLSHERFGKLIRAEKQTLQLQPPRVRQIACGWNHISVLYSNGRVLTVEDEDYGICETREWSNIEKLAAGYHVTLGIQSGGKAFAAGENSDGQCDVQDWDHIEAVAAGRFHSLGIRGNGSVAIAGELPINNDPVEAWRGIQNASAGVTRTLGLKWDRRVVSAGYGEDSAREIRAWQNIKKIVSGYSHDLALDEDGRVFAAGCTAADKKLLHTWCGITDLAAGAHFSAGLQENGNVLVAVHQKGDPEAELIARASNLGTDVEMLAAGADFLIGLKNGRELLYAGTPDRFDMRALMLE